MTELEELDTTESGAIPKQKAMEWLHSLDDPDEAEMKDAITPKPYEHEGSTYDDETTTIRITGDAEAITEIAKMFKWMLDFEGAFTRLDMKLQRVEDNETGELTDNYALYLSAAERGSGN